MQTSTFFGYKCPKCQTKIDVAAIGGSDKLLCPNCHTEMIPDPQGKTSSANVYCRKCNASFGLVNSDRCPQCGGPFTKLKRSHPLTSFLSFSLITTLIATGVAGLSIIDSIKELKEGLGYLVVYAVVIPFGYLFLLVMIRFLFTNVRKVANLKNVLVQVFYNALDASHLNPKMK